MPEPADDFRSDRMPSAEGHGRARRAWEAYATAVNTYAGPVLRPVLQPVASKVAASVVADLFGFWLCWHLEGGFEGMQRVGMSRSAIYRRIGKFRKVFGAHPDDFEMPGVSIDLEAYHQGDIKIV